MGVWQAPALDRRMREPGLDTPFVTGADPPSDDPKLGPHQNAKYAFEPMPDYRPPEL